MYLQPEDIIKILLAVLAGGIIGIERELRDKAAGFRTLIFICVGSTLYTIFSVYIAGDKDPARIAAQIVTGVGFLGAGVILRDGGRVMGLTTAAMVWLTAALGMGLGSGQYLLIGITVVLITIILWFFPKIEHRIDSMSEDRTYEISCIMDPDKIMQLEENFRTHGLNIRSHSHIKQGDQIVILLQARGRPKAHDAITKQLFADEGVKEFRY